MESPHSYMGSNLYLTPPSHPPRRKSPVFYLLFAVDLAVVTIFVLSISRLGKEIRQEQLQTGGWFKILYDPFFPTCCQNLLSNIATSFITVRSLTPLLSLSPPPCFSRSRCHFSKWCIRHLHHSSLPSVAYVEAKKQR